MVPWRSESRSVRAVASADRFPVDESRATVGGDHDAREHVLSRRASRRPAPPSVRIADPVPWGDPDDVAVPLWRKVLSAVELGLLIVVLGVLLTVAFGLALLGLFFLLDWIVG